MPTFPAPTRRTLLRTAAVASGAGAVAALPLRPTPAVAVPHQGTRLVLLGTSGGPVPMHGRAGIASALVVDGRVYLVDCGPGTFGRYAEAWLTAEQLTAVFVTHLHSDHLSDLYPLLWLRFGGFQPLGGPVHVYGPGSAGTLPAVHPAGRSVRTECPSEPAPGTKDLIAGHLAATAYDVNVRMRSEGWPDIRELIVPHDIRFRPPKGAGPRKLMAPPMEPFEVMRDERVRVTAVLVEHPPVYPSFAYRFDTADGSVVFSGDTAPCGNVARLARGADILVHEVMDLDTLALGGLNPAQRRHMEISHTDATRVGPLAERAGVPTLVLSHLVPGATNIVPDATWHTKASRGYSGRVVVGHDLTHLPLGTAAARRN
ncbi:MBL fold metallo-hydrolase [Streptomyces sp. TRM72054]|uniref:MBL fold metallo-hydrolase n=1 Tax=Streptomyces sp. TRM72054 TaxID=2870562 RepID=UPI001C8CD248|nr:MBL fold metallo-hydrolase [Streptomyces sp. TRM72054]MBX9395324.1 MBL fold metallo-hydrolase [Streptomyces sp. TRM72054]